MHTVFIQDLTMSSRYFDPERRYIGWSVRTYAESKSLLAVSIEHALYGILIFSIGFNSNFLNSVVLDLNIFSNRLISVFLSL